MHALPSTSVESHSPDRRSIGAEEMNAFLDAMLQERARARIKQLVAERRVWISTEAKDEATLWAAEPEPP